MMTSNATKTLNEEIRWVCELAKEAGQRAMAMLERPDLNPEFKADDSYVTHIDRETERFLYGRLSARFPGWAFQGEEYGRVEAQKAEVVMAPYHHVGASQREVWLRDPDGYVVVLSTPDGASS